MFRSITAILAGFISVAVLSIATDQVLHSLHVYPPLGQPMHDTGLLTLALTYRTIYNVLGGYLTAWLAPRRAMRLVIILGVGGTITACIGAIVAIFLVDLGPAWYPVLLAAFSFPSVYLGGLLHARTDSVARA